MSQGMWAAFRSCLKGKEIVLASLDCYNKIVQTGWLRAEVYFSQFWRLRSPRFDVR